VIDIPVLLDRLCYRYPSMLVDAITEHEPGRRLVVLPHVEVTVGPPVCGVLEKDRLVVRQPGAAALLS